MRFNFALFPEQARAFAPLFIVLAIIGIIYGALVAMVQPDVKRLVAYSSVSHMGFVILGMFSFTEWGMQGALYQMLNHGVSTGALFLLVGMIYERRHTRMISEFGGLSKPMPWLRRRILNHVRHVELDFKRLVELVGDGARGDGRDLGGGLHALDVAARAVRARDQSGEPQARGFELARDRAASASARIDALHGRIPAAVPRTLARERRAGSHARTRRRVAGAIPHEDAGREVDAQSF
jgi:hypothetical protein